MFKATTRPLYPRERPGTNCTGGWMDHRAPVWTGAQNLAPTGIRSPDCPFHSESLYRLSYPGPEVWTGFPKHQRSIQHHLTDKIPSLKGQSHIYIAVGSFGFFHSTGIRYGQMSVLKSAETERERETKCGGGEILAGCCAKHDVYYGTGRGGGGTRKFTAANFSKQYPLVLRVR